jgi:hypothetical protein
LLATKELKKNSVLSPVVTLSPQFRSSPGASSRLFLSRRTGKKGAARDGFSTEFRLLRAAKAAAPASENPVLEPMRAG